MENKLELFYPVKPAVVNQGFGVNGAYYRANGINIAGHNGWDFAAEDGDPVRAAHDGVVVFSGVDDRGGEMIELVSIEACDFKLECAYAKTIYGHLKTGTRTVKAGDGVRVGDVIAHADNTGLSTGSHLHFGLKRVVPEGMGRAWRTLDPDNGYLGAIDPTPYFTGYYAEDAAAVKSTMEKIITLEHLTIDDLRELIAREVGTMHAR